MLLLSFPKVFTEYSIPIPLRFKYTITLYCKYYLKIFESNDWLWELETNLHTCERLVDPVVYSATIVVRDRMYHRRNKPV